MVAPDFSTSPPDPRIKSAMETGPAKLRPRTSMAVRPVSGTTRCRQDQVARIDRFWLEDLKKGTLPFLFPDQIYNNANLLTDGLEQLLTDEDEVLLVSGWHLVQFAEPPRSVPLRRSTMFAVSLSLNVLP
jgi:hypothetical protein